MVKGTLMKKSIQGHEKVKGPSLSPSLLWRYPCGQRIVTGLDSIWKTIDDHAEALYEATNLSDLWVNVANPTEKELCGHFKGIEGVETAEKRFTMNADTDYKRKPDFAKASIHDFRIIVYLGSAETAGSGKFLSGGGAVLDIDLCK